MGGLWERVIALIDSKEPYITNLKIREVTALLPGVFRCKLEAAEALTMQFTDIEI